MSNNPMAYFNKKVIKFPPVDRTVKKQDNDLTNTPKRIKLATLIGYTIGNKQPVTCTYIADTVNFYID